MRVEKTAKVAPYAGAWIETAASKHRSSRQHWVAPYAGAWIETGFPSLGSSSPPTRGRGLWTVCHVAPYAGAWIETMHPLKSGGRPLVETGPNPCA